MAKNSKKEGSIVRQHLRRVPVTKKNPTGVTVVRQHFRRLPGSSLDAREIESTFKSHDRKDLVYPTPGKLNKYTNADKYDEIIAVWADYFNKKFNANPPLDPDVVKALIASESGFRADPSENKKAFGITQITPDTLEILQNPRGETKDFIFEKISQKDLKDPNVAIPMAIRWLHRKRATAKNQLGRVPNDEELILEYKGMLKSKTDLKDKALKNYRENHGRLKKK
jgi:hypothetical protein